MSNTSGSTHWLAARLLQTGKGLRVIALLSLLLGMFGPLMGVTPTLADTVVTTAGSGQQYTVAQQSSPTFVSGTLLLGSQCDDCNVAVTLPFAYTFYGTSHAAGSPVQLNSNGVLAFGSASPAKFTNTPLPASGFSDAIFGYWSDLRTDGGNGGIFTSISGTAPNRIWTVQWTSSVYTNNSSKVYFEIRLYEGEQRFDIEYGTKVDPAGNPATVGVQQGTGSNWTQQEFNTTNSIQPSTGYTYTYAGDNTAPQSSASATLTGISPEASYTAGTWTNNTAGVTVHLSGSDNTGGSGVKNITYTESGAQTNSGTITGSSGSVPVTTEGSTTITYFATDNAGNIESPSHTFVVNLDLTKPATAANAGTYTSGSWTNANSVSIGLNATDRGSGVHSITYSATGAQTIASTVTNGATATVSNITNEGTTTVSYYATDNAGNVELTKTFTVMIDRTNPVIKSSRTPLPLTSGWNSTPVEVDFTCLDPNNTTNGTAGSGIPSASAPISPQYVNSDGGSQSRTGTCTDAAGNSVSSTVSNINVDQTGPQITGTIASQPSGTNASGAKWYKGDVAVNWACTDPASATAANSTTSGVANCAGTNGASGNGTITGEGSGLTTTGTATDVAGNSTIGTSPAVNIDRTAPVTTVKAPNGWNTSSVTLNLNATDGTGSGVAHTYYTVDGSQSEGTSVNVSGDGTHTVTFWSVDYAGNMEATNTVQVKIDGTKPNITLTSPSPILPWYNASNSPVTLTYSCTDATSGIATCDGVPNTTGTNNSTGSNSFGTEGKSKDSQATAVDNAGNSALADTILNIDLTAPSLTGAVTSTAQPSNGWYKTPVTVEWTFSDALSGIATSPANVTLSTDGGSQSVSGTATDVAGNSTTKTVDGINIDQTAPTISGDPTTPDHNGWYTGDVMIHWTCADNAPANAVNTTTSGLAGTCPADSKVTGEGNNVSTSVSVNDNAGNTGTGSRSVQIDRTAPITTASYAAANTHGWYSGAVTVTLTGNDNLSGIDSSKDGSGTFYTVDGGATQTYTAPFQVDGSAVHHVTFWSVDVAGNVEAHDPTANPGNTITLQIDETKPTITASRTGTDYASSHNGWNNTDVTASFDCQDVPSGIYSCTAPVTLNKDGAGTDGSGQSVTGTAVDLAGNSATATQGGIKIDETPPNMKVASIKTADGKDYTPGTWTNQAVTVTFACTDATSGVASFTDPVTVSAEGPSQGAKGTCADVAGNEAEASVDNINIDTTAPVITASRTPAPNGNGWNNTDVTVTFSCTDPNNVSNNTAGSGVATEPVSPQVVNTDRANQSKTATCTDAAGNTASATLGNINVDETNPTLSGTPTSQPNGKNGWYTSPVTIAWTCGDATSGIDATLSSPAAPSGSTTGCPDNSTITNDGSGVTASASVTDKAGNQVTKASQAVNLDQKPPVTGADAPQGWVQSDTLHLTPQDDTSGVAVTHYQVDNGNWQTSTTFPVSINLTTTGTHTVNFWSEDVAGNQETQHSVQIKVDASAPDVKPSQSPDANGRGWNKSTVKVTYTCSDADSGIKSCDASFGTTTNTSTSDNTPTSNTTPSIQSSVDVTSEGKNQTTTGTGTDVVGNQATSQYLVNIDETAPDLSGATTPTSPNGNNGWYTSPVTVHWTYSDALSGIPDGNAPSDTTLSSDGGNQSVSGTATDAADNSTTKTVDGINIDQTAPTITGAAATPPNGNGWYKGDVTIQWTCVDNAPANAANTTTSGVATCPADSTITGEGTNLGDSESGTDKAGNTGTGKISGIKIDRTAPATTASYAAANSNGWYNAPVTVTLNATDGGSGVDTTYYTVDGGAQQTYSGPFLVSGDKVHTVNYWSVDKAGNVEDKTASGNTIQLQIDTTNPTITGSFSPAPNSAGWNNTNVLVHFSCDDALSGVSNCTPDQTVSIEGAGQTVKGTATDKAGNMATFTVQNINIDKTAPVITYTGNAGTYSLTDTVNITCAASDTLSGVASSTCQNVNVPAYTFAIGANTLSATAIDKAGNPGSGSTTFTVGATFSNLCTLTQQFMKPDPNEANSLCSKLTNAQADAAKGNTTAKNNVLSAYKNELNAQSGKDFTPAQVVILTKWASTL